MTTQTTSRDAAQYWLINQFHEVGDAVTASRMHEIYAKNSVLRFGNLEPLHGVESITAFFEHQFAVIHTMKHKVVKFDVVGNTIYQEVDITYTIIGDPDRISIKIPGFAVLERIPAGEEEEGKLRSAEIYLDPAPLVKRIGEVAALKGPKE